MKPFLSQMTPFQGKNKPRGKMTRLYQFQNNNSNSNSENRSHSDDKK